MTPRGELILAYVLSAAASLTTGALLYLRRRSTPGARSFAYVLFFETWWTLAGIGEHASVSFEAKRFWDDAQFLPAVLAPVESLMFALAYTGRTPRHPMRVRFAISLLPLVCALFVLTDTWHGLARASAHVVPGGPVDTLHYDFTPIETLTFTYNFLLIALASGLLLRRMASEHRVFRTQTGLALFALLLPSILGVAMMMGLRFLGMRDFTPLAFGVCGVLMVFAVGRRRFLDLVPFARDSVVESVSDAVFLLDERGRLVDLNAAGRELASGSMERILGQSVRDVLPALAPALEAARGSQTTTHPVRLQTGHGERSFEALVTTVQDAPGSKVGTALLLRDVTERVRAADALRRAHDELEERVRERTHQLSEANEALSQANLALMAEMKDRIRAERERAALEQQLRSAQRIEAIGRLAGGVAHDFNNLLTAIHVNIDLIERRAKGDPKMLELIEPVKTASDSAADLTRQLLALSRDQVLEPRAIDVDEAVTRIRRMLERILGDEVTLSVELGARGARIFCDPGQLDRIVLNLAVNARDAIESEGCITIRTSVDEVAEARACVDGSVMAPGRYATLAVRDTGSGIAEDVLGKMFEPFFTTKPEGRGTGLGLAMVREAVERFGGHVEVETEVGRGSEFRVRFGVCE